MNVSLLRQVQKTILEEPRRGIMFTWMHYACTDTPCGTSACIAGWTLILSELGQTPKTEDIRKTAVSWSNTIYLYGGLVDVEDVAARRLGVTKEQARKLFHVLNWPEDLRMKTWGLGEGTPEYAAVMSEAIDRFIEDPARFDEPNRELLSALFRGL